MRNLERRKLKDTVGILKQFIHRFTEDQTTDLAATLAYYFLLSLFPLSIFMFSLVPYIGLSEKELFAFISRYVPAVVVGLLKQNLVSLLQKSSSLMSLGILATIWSASNALNAMVRTLNHAYRVKETRPFLLTRLLSFVLTILMVFAIVISLAINVIFNGLVHQFLHFLGLSSEFAWLWTALSMLLSFLLIITIFACLYKFGPNMFLKWREVIIGAVIAGVGWQMASYGFSFYVRYFNNYSSTYGTLGAIIILMVWFYLTAIMILVGGQINAILRIPHSNEDKKPLIPKQ
ncbi:YihY/virulence factor BrkB family protein [Sporolactobacillus spathodeae]|uniref:Membrane protein n=1 Tax=Sporolactobacillus spathodeae TaxID=1465502 RepID=A0ABS2Q6Q3_9BACL|nr:YihY/virulence factor BrkB family protein [Sporolactobacillus spathodeae]MBM7657472.1 membrane protein [Sporolactobacillus spathodeae]